MSEYVHRTIDELLDTYQPHLPAIELYGAKGVGKTATAQQRVTTVVRLDSITDAELLMADPQLIMDLPGPVLIDEWSRVPQSWDLVRRAIDDGAPNGRFLLNGSAKVPKGISVHSGAGRIVRFRMRPMSLAERGIQEPTVSLANILKGHTEVQGQSSFRLIDYVREIIASGFPGLRSYPPRMRNQLLTSYLDNLVQREFPEQGHLIRKPAVLKAWLTAYVAATATTTSYNRILDASTPGEHDKPAKTTTLAYRDTLAELWMLDSLDAWLPTRNRLERLTQAPKHYLADPGLACRLLNLNENTLIHGHDRSSLGEGTILGALFEHLAVLSMRVYAQANEAQVYHFRTYRGEHEIDMIIESNDGGIVAVEVKLSQSVNDKDIQHIRWLRDRIGPDFIAGIVLTTGEHAYRRSDGIMVIPLALITS